MTEITRSEVSDFSRVFEQACNFVAVSKVGDRLGTVKGLVLLCLSGDSDGKHSESVDFINTIAATYGTQVFTDEVDSALLLLEEDGSVSRLNEKFYLSAQAQETLKGNVSLEKQLESNVRQTWAAELHGKWPDLDVDCAWEALQKYLCKMFRRHGLQAAALLDPSVTTPDEYEEGLTFSLKQSIRECFGEDQVTPVTYDAVSSFLRDAPNNTDRTKYIIQLADAAFSFYTMEIAPELAEGLRDKLSDLTLFLDTNFLFGILGLHSNSQVEVSKDLIRAINEYDFPFRLRYFPETLKEFNDTLSYYGDRLKGRRWSKMLSSAACQAKRVGGIELKYHELNAETATAPSDFLNRFAHADIILKENKIDVYRGPDGNLTEEATLFSEYDEFLKNKSVRHKFYEQKMHDAKVLLATQQLRTTAKNSLHAGALFITCDYWLYRFDWVKAFRNDHLACVLLPNIFWQMLRPFIPQNKNFDRAFAETFALPEFRTIQSGGVKACSRMLSVMSTYKDLPQETAIKMLSNDLLLDRLADIEEDDKFQEEVELALIEENKALLEEKAAVDQALEREREQNEQERLAREDAEKQARTLGENLGEASGQIEELSGKVSSAILDAERERELRGKAEALAEKTASEAAGDKILAAQAQRFAFMMKIVAAFSLCILSIVIFELAVFFGPITYIKTHSNHLPLNILVCFAMICFWSGVFFRKVRKQSWWSAALLGAFFGVMSLLGGKADEAESAVPKEETDKPAIEDASKRVPGK